MEVTAERLKVLAMFDKMESFLHSTSTGTCNDDNDQIDNCDADDNTTSEVENDNVVDIEEVEADDAMLGSLQRGLKTISSHARAYMNTCTTDENRKSMQDRLENSMLGLLKSEHVIKELPILVTDVVDKFVTDLEAEEAAEESDSDEPLHFFKPLHKGNEEKMDHMSQKLFKMFQEKVNDYENTLTEEHLKKHPRFAQLEKEVALSFNEFEDRINETAIVNGAGDTSGADDELLDTVVKFHNPDELSDDESILPSIDPLTKSPMMNPVRNKFCNHVFEEGSVMNYIVTDSNPKCPLEYCRNSRLFEKDHFIKVPKLTQQIRKKNMKEKNDMSSKLF